MSITRNIQKLIDKKLITNDQALNLTTGQRVALESKGIQQLIEKEYITVDQALNLTTEQRCALENKDIQQLSDPREITNRIRAQGVQSKVPSLQETARFFAKMNMPEQFDNLPSSVKKPK
tara:strand:+ start:159 stop:518 length:360 start_codon:yes stop_codon:yes gene_type:complete